MRSASDAALALRDASLPGLPVLLDAEKLQATLQSCLPHQDLRSVRVDYLRYKPGTNCIAALSLDLGGVPTLAYAKALRSSDRTRAESRHASTNASHAVLLPSIATEFHLFPSDHKLPHLPRVTDVAWAALRSPRPSEDAPHSPVLSIEPLAYKPERRFVARWHLADGRSFVAKTYLAQDFDAVRRNAESAQLCRSVRLARLSGVRERRATLLFPWIDAQPLAASLPDPRLSESTLHEVGDCLARFHQHPAPDHLPGRFPPDEARRIANLLPAITCLVPESQPLLEHLVANLSDTIRQHPPARHLCHGDFHAGQVLLNQEGLHLLDFDELHVGDPLTDLASFIAHLERETIRGRLTASRRDTFSAAILHGYASAQRTPIPSHLPTLVAARLLAETPHFFRTRDPHWSDHTLAAVERASEIARSRSSHTASLHTTVSPLPTAHDDPGLPTLASALDPAIAAVFILPVLATRLRLESPRITDVQLRRHKPGRRCLIEYQVAPGDGTTPIPVLAKLRRRGVDTSNFDFLQALAANGFHPEAPDGISIPTPLGAIPSLGLVLHQRVAGTPLTQRLSDPDAPQLAVRTAEALLKLHRTRHTLPRRHAVTDELDHLESQLTRTAEALPELQQRILGVLDDCQRLAERLPAARPTQLHRDFYPDQILIDGSRLWIVDFDLAAVGDPALDAGNFVAHLIEHGLRFHHDAAALSPVIQAFRTHYLGRSGVPVESLHAWTTLALARHIAISHRMTERNPTTTPLVALCEERLSLGLLAWPTL